MYNGCILFSTCFFFFSSRRRHTSSKRDWSSDVCSSDLYTRTDKFLRPDINRTLLIRDLCSQCLEPFDMLVNRAWTQVAATWQPNDRFLEFAKHGSHKIIGSTQFLDFTVRERHGNHLRQVDVDGLTIPTHTP